jgi:tetratricopeptide (TPR) repeat protein
MSEIAVTPVRIKGPRTKMLMAAVSVLILLLAYGAGIILLPISILTKYQSKNCDSVSSLNNVYTRIYPGFLQDKTLASPVDECEAYGLAASKEVEGNWREAYDSYQAYSMAYPNGLYAPEAHQHSATALLNVVEHQVEGQQYAEAVANLGLIVSDYSDTSELAEAWTLFPSIYTSWGTGLREAEDFEGAERVFTEFKTWSRKNQKAESEQASQSEFAQTYLAWGRALRSQKQFEAALAKFDMAASAHPESAAQAQAGKVDSYIDWGNDFLGQKEFAMALEKFGQAVSLADADKKADASAAFASGQIQWASALSADEDFEASLEHLEVARQNAVTENVKQSVETAFRDTYLAFSNSSGSQARRAMKEALITICKKHKEPDLPIFGIKPDSIRVGNLWRGGAIT